MFCPNCKRKHKAHLSVCPYCSKLSAEKAGDFPTIVFAVVRNQPEEDMLIDALKKGNIECVSRLSYSNINRPHIQNINAAGREIFSGDNFFMKEILINKAKLEKAKNILKNLREETGLG